MAAFPDCGTWVDPGTCHNLLPLTHHCAERQVNKLLLETVGCLSSAITVTKTFFKTDVGQYKAGTDWKGKST